MAEAVITEIVAAPARIVWEQILAAVEAPQRFAASVGRAEIVERGEGYLLRRVEMAGWTRAERVEIDDVARQATFALRDDPLAEGTLVARVFEHGASVPLLCLMECVADWRPVSRRRGPRAVEVLLAECRDTMAAVKRAAENLPRR